MTFKEWANIVGAKDPRYDSMVVDIITDWKAEREVFLERIEGLQSQVVNQDAERGKLIEALEETEPILRPGTDPTFFHKGLIVRARYHWPIWIRFDGSEVIVIDGDEPKALRDCDYLELKINSRGTVEMWKHEEKG